LWIILAENIKNIGNLSQKELASAGVEPLLRDNLSILHDVSAKLASVWDNLPEVLKKSHQKLLSAQPLFFLVLHLIDDTLDVLDSSLDGIQRLLENVPSSAVGASRRGWRRWRWVRGGSGESEQGMGEDEEERGAKGTWEVEVMGGGGGGGEVEAGGGG
jgi:hypothetical protein